MKSKLSPFPLAVGDLGTRLGKALGHTRLMDFPSLAGFPFVFLDAKVILNMI